MRIIKFTRLIKKYQNKILKFDFLINLVYHS